MIRNDWHFTGEVGIGMCTAQKENTTIPVNCHDNLMEWNFGDYEGMTTAEINASRAKLNLAPWDIWLDGCPNGE